MEECAGCKLQFDPQEESVFPASALDRDGRSASGGGGGCGDVGWVEVIGTAGDTELLCCDCYIERRAMAERLAPASGRPLCAAGAAAAATSSGHGGGGGAASSVASSAHTPEPTDIYAPAVRHALLYRSTPLTFPSGSPPPPPRHPPMPMRASSAGSSDAAVAVAQVQPAAAAAPPQQASSWAPRQKDTFLTRRLLNMHKVGGLPVEAVRAGRTSRGNSFASSGRASHRSRSGSPAPAVRTTDGGGGGGVCDDDEATPQPRPWRHNTLVLNSSALCYPSYEGCEPQEGTDAARWAGGGGGGGCDSSVGVGDDDPLAATVPSSAGLSAAASAAGPTSQLSYQERWRLRREAERREHGLRGRLRDRLASRSRSRSGSRASGRPPTAAATTAAATQRASTVDLSVEKREWRQTIVSISEEHKTLYLPRAEGLKPEAAAAASPVPTPMPPAAASDEYQCRIVGRTHWQYLLFHQRVPQLAALSENLSFSLVGLTEVHPAAASEAAYRAALGHTHPATLGPFGTLEEEVAVKRRFEKLVFHGTHERLFPQILREGLRTGGAERAAHLSKDLSQAAAYANVEGQSLEEWRAARGSEGGGQEAASAGLLALPTTVKLLAFRMVPPAVETMHTPNEGCWYDVRTNSCVVRDAAMLCPKFILHLRVERTSSK